MTKKKRALIIDHYDSFTYNVKEWFSTSSFDVHVQKWDRVTATLNDFDLLILSPGPGAPDEYKETEELVNRVMGKKPIFGICLGMQLLLTIAGDKIDKLSNPTHGKRSMITTDESLLFAGIPKQISVARYHSLGTETASNYNITATLDDLVMAVESHDKSVIAVQFHPESFLTEHRDILLSNITDWVNRWQSNQ